MIRLFIILLFGAFLCQAQEQEKLYIEMAQHSINSQNLPEALVYLDSASILSPADAKIPLMRAGIYTAQEEYRQAINSYDEAVKINPSLDNAYSERALLRNKVGDHREYSLRDIDQAISIDPSNTEYLIQKASFLSNRNNPQTGLPDHDEAIRILSQAIRMEPDSGRYINLRGKIKFESEQPLAAIGDFSDAIYLDPENGEFYGDRGLTYLLIENYQSAIHDFTTAIRLDPLNHQYIQKRGHAKFNKGDYDQAVDDFTLAINTIYRKVSLTSGRIDQNNPLNKALQENFLFRGSALLQVGAVYEACRDFKSARNLGNRRASNYVKRYCH